MNDDNNQTTTPVSESSSEPSQTPDSTQAVTSTSSLVKDFSIPVSILLAGALIGAGLFFSRTPMTSEMVGQAEVPTEVAQPVDTTDAINPVTEADYIKGSLNAKVTIVEYSDFECPFCKQFHDTINAVLQNYSDEQVAWVFRQFPLEQLHPVKAMAAANASECVGELGGNDAFWSFTDGYFDRTLTNNRTDIETLIPQLVTEAGVDKNSFTACFEANRHLDDINEDIENAVATGGRGTPWSVVIGPNGDTYPLNGALPEAALTQLIDQLLAQ